MAAFLEILVSLLMGVTHLTTHRVGTHPGLPALVSRACGIPPRLTMHMHHPVGDHAFPTLTESRTGSISPSSTTITPSGPIQDLGLSSPGNPATSSGVTGGSYVQAYRPDQTTEQMQGISGRGVVQIARQGRNHLCSDCSGTFSTNHELEQHIQQLHADKFICDVEGCRKLFKSKRSLLRHKESAQEHQNADSPQYHCACGYRSSRKDHHRTHVRSCTRAISK
ncbi:hypothetical protein GGR56DRAFT_196266 [Xylariaceae sp. FL0804]|nr:hypothetical protein GGR56DRAFT_196266 [Xylariaceae sp. FL0804]